MTIEQGIDGSASKPALVFFYRILAIMVEKTYHIAPYLDAFEAYLLPQLPIKVLECISMDQNNRWYAVNSCFFHLVKKLLILDINDTKRLYG